MYLSEVHQLLECISRRKNSDALLQLMIIHNPYVKDPNALFRELKGGFDRIEPSENIDRAGLEKFKKRLQKESKFIKVKK
jgi:hypothetical protein